MSVTSDKRPHVLIIGGGLGGMALAQVLRKQGMSFEIFERDEAPNARFQGWALSLHWIVAPLLEAIPDDLPSLETASHFWPLKMDAQMGMWNAMTGELEISIESSEEKKMIRANRSHLRNLLATHLDINWGKRFTRYEETSDGVTVFFADGTSAHGDVLIAADGVHSHVREQLFSTLPSANKLRTIPIGMILGQTRITKAQYSAQMKIGRSAYVCVGDHGERIFAGLKEIAPDQESAEYYWMVSWPDPAAAAADEDPRKAYWLASASKQELYDYALEETKNFQPEMREIIRLTPVEGMQAPPLVVRDLIPQEAPLGRVALVGDAAHSMSPFRGEGGNHAIMDAIVLAKCLAKAEKDSIPEALKEYERMMVERTRPAVEKSRVATQEDPYRSRKNWADNVNAEKTFGKLRPEVETA